jgi:type IV pilus assembly protein PilY1
MNKTKRTHPWQRGLAAFLSLQIALGPLADPAYAVLTQLADEPVGFTTQAEPNIVLTVDDSTSMLSDFLPDYIIGTVPGTGAAFPAPNNVTVGGFCRDSVGRMSVACGFVGQPDRPAHIYYGASLPFPNYSPGNPPNALPAYSASTMPDWMRAWPAPVHSNALNRVYYDPAITYRPPLRYDGTPYPDQDLATTTTWTKVIADPWAPSAAMTKYVNILANVNVGMWCSSDFPNNSNWNPKTGGGAECRVNGTDYSTVAPFAQAEYQYPWRGGSPNPSYFFRNYEQTGAWNTGSAGNNSTWRKTLWCDGASPKWPRVSGASCTTTYTCPGGTYLPKMENQYCRDTGPKTTCDPTTYSPAGCNTNPLYGSPGPCVGSECLTCTANVCPSTTTVGRVGRCRWVSNNSVGSNANCDCTPAGCTVNPAHAACTPQVNNSVIGTCSNGVVPVPTVTCPKDSGACNKYLWDDVAGVATATTMLMDANGAGIVCRRNNIAYAGVAASPFNYPSGVYTTRVITSCPTVPASASVPRHYWKVSVEWCSGKVTAAGDKWLGFGLPGTCQDEHDLAHPNPRFYKYGVRKTDPEYLDNYAFPAFERVDLVNDGRTYTHNFFRNGNPVTVTRTAHEEFTNYANWFAYYRTRIQAAKTVISQNFTYLDDTYRVGFHTLSNVPTSSYVDLAPFDAALGGQKDRWYQQLFAIAITMGKQTPNIEAVVRIGELFRNGGNPALIGSTDPITLSCQKNYHMLFTDGITNQPALPAVTVGNRDDIVPPLPEPLPTAIPPIVAGAPWPNLFRENTGASAGNTLADYTTHYWVTDMRPAMTNNVLRGKDPAPWQHLNFAALSLGTEGVLTATSTGATELQIAAGTLLWPTPTPNSWQPGPTGVDDLWHAAVNGRGRFVNAKTSQQLGRGIAGILSDITSPAGSNSGATFANPNLSATNNFTYIPSFVQGWGGNLQKVQIDPITAASIGVFWDAQSAMITQTTPTIPVPDPWYSQRNIVTLNDAGAPVPFRRASLGPAQLATLGPDAATQDRVIEYLRGRRDMEGEDDGQFRVRPSPLGDIVHSQPVIVGPMSWDYWDYSDANDPGYSAFKATYAARPARVYVGANDGMLHAFDDSNGREAWAFVPRDLYRSAPPVSNDKAGLIGLTYQPGGLPIYAHRFYVDATPRVVDANLNGTWKTMLVSGLGKGGKSYFALDVTDPASVVDEASATGKFLWEFRHPDLGYTYGRPTIAKTRAHGWVVVFSAGYNNPSGEGKLFFVRAHDGALLKTMSTGTGTPLNPSGMVHFTGFKRDYRNELIDQIYAGDLFGNVWRFDVSDPNEANWQVQRFAVLTDGGGTPQPVTTPPRVDVDIANGVDRWVFVGTGRLLHVDDLADNQRQTMWALRDGIYNQPSVIGAPLTRADLDVVAGINGLGANVIAPRGWLHDLPVGQRIVRTPVAAIGLVGYIATSQPIDPCETGLPATIYLRQFGNGESRLEPGGVLVDSIYEPSGAASIEMIATYPPGCVDNCIPTIKLAVLSSSTSSMLTFQAKLPGIAGDRRMSWRSLSQ